MGKFPAKAALESANQGFVLKSLLRTIFRMLDNLCIKNGSIRFGGSAPRGDRRD